MKKIFLLLFITTQAYGFTLVSKPPIFFPNNEITINVSSNTCTGIGISTTDLLDLTENAMNRFWNAAPTSAINIKRGAVISAGIAGTENLTAVRAAASPGTILVACSTHADLTVNTGGIGGITSDGTNVRGGLILNNNVGSFVANYSDAQIETLIAHEVGHAIGISHSEDPAALMYYALTGVQEVLAEDDIDAVTYLYPHDSTMGCLGAFGTIKRPPTQGPDGNWLLSLALGLILILLSKIRITRTC